MEQKLLLRLVIDSQIITSREGGAELLPRLVLDSQIMTSREGGAEALTKTSTWQSNYDL